MDKGSKHSKSGSTSSNPTKWRSIRPWQPPNQLREPHPSQNMAQAYERPRLSRKKSGHLNLEVVDVSSTAVSLAVFGPQSSSSSPSSEGTPPNLSIKLNSAPWPHVFHSDATSFEHDSSSRPVPGTLSSTPKEGEVGATIVIFGLSPGKQYNIELGVIEQPTPPATEPNELLEEAEIERPSTASTTVTTNSSPMREVTDSPLPEDAPPPYSPRLDDSLENSLKDALKSLKATTKATESSLQASIATLKKTVDKASREDQRLRQKIRLFEDSEARLREVEEEEKASAASILESVEGTNKTEEELVQIVEKRRATLAEQERQGKEESDIEDAKLDKLREQLESLNKREEALIAERQRCEREILPAYNIRLATLEADLRRIAEDARRQQHFMQAHAAQAYYYPAPVPVTKANRYLPLRSNFPPTQFTARPLSLQAHPSEPYSQSASTYDPTHSSLFSQSPPTQGFLDSLNEDSPTVQRSLSPSFGGGETHSPIASGLRQRSVSVGKQDDKPTWAMVTGRT